MAIRIIKHNSTPLEELETTNYTVFFFNDCSIFTTVTRSADTVDDWISEVTDSCHQNAGRLIVGLDAEWRPNFTAGGEQNRLAVLQLCVGGRCLIYQIWRSYDWPELLDRFLCDENNVFVGVNVNYDLNKLQSDYGIGGYALAVDLRNVSANACVRYELKSAGLKTLASAVLGREVEMPKAVTLSEWDSFFLTPEQVKYACIDAFLSFEIATLLNENGYLDISDPKSIVFPFNHLPKVKA